MATDKVTLNCARLDPEVATIEYVARLSLGLRRGGRVLRLHGASSDLLALLRLCGLGEALRVEVQGQPEEGEQPSGVEEERELGDAPA